MVMIFRLRLGLTRTLAASTLLGVAWKLLAA
jgi:hypothetical protein